MKSTDILTPKHCVQIAYNATTILGFSYILNSGAGCNRGLKVH